MAQNIVFPWKVFPRPRKNALLKQIWIKILWGKVSCRPVSFASFFLPNEWFLGNLFGIPCRFCRGGRHHHQLNKGERDWYQYHWMHSLLFDYYQLQSPIFVSLCMGNLQQISTRAPNMPLNTLWVFILINIHLYTFFVLIEFSCFTDSVGKMGHFQPSLSILNQTVLNCCSSTLVYNRYLEVVLVSW